MKLRIRLDYWDTETLSVWKQRVVDIVDIMIGFAFMNLIIAILITHYLVIALNVVPILIGILIKVSYNRWRNR